MPPSRCSAAHRLRLHPFPTRRSSDLYLEAIRLAAAIARVTASAPPPLVDIDELCARVRGAGDAHARAEDRKSTRLNSSHVRISYAVFCLKKKKQLVGLRCSCTERERP